MFSCKFNWKSIALTTCFVSSVFAQGTTTTTSLTRTFNFPPVGIASSETAQINVTNLAPASSGGTAASCAGSVSFTNATGAAIWDGYQLHRRDRPDLVGQPAVRQGRQCGVACGDSRSGPVDDLDYGPGALLA